MIINDEMNKKFLNKIEKTDYCWLWKGARSKSGYGNLWINYKRYYAHRISYIIYIGKIKNGLCVCHKCDNPQCVNPKHLFLGSNADNANDRYRKGRTAHGEGSGTSKLKEKDVIEIRKLYKLKSFTQKKISSLFSVGQDEISRIINGKRWNHIK